MPRRPTSATRDPQRVRQRTGSPMSTVLDKNRLVLAVSGGTGLDASPHVLTTAARAGALPVLDLATGDAWALRGLEETARHASGLAVRVTAECAVTPAELVRSGGDAVTVVVLAADGPWPIAE